MWSLGNGDRTLRAEFQQFRRDANQEIEQLSYHIASLNNIEFGTKIQENFLMAIQKYSHEQGSSPYYLYHLLQEYNLYFIAVLFSMINSSKDSDFQHRFCMLAEFLCKGCWTFMDQLAFLKLINILLVHSDHLNSLLLSSTQSSAMHNPITAQNQKFKIYHNFIQWIQMLSVPKTQRVSQSTMDNKYHNHSYPDLNRERIFDFLNLLVLNRPDILYKLVSFLEIARNIHNESGICLPLCN